MSEGTQMLAALGRLLGTTFHVAHFDSHMEVG